MQKIIFLLVSLSEIFVLHRWHRISISFWSEEAIIQWLPWFRSKIIFTETCVFNEATTEYVQNTIFIPSVKTLVLN